MNVVEILTDALDENACYGRPAITAAPAYRVAIRQALEAMRGEDPDWTKAPPWAQWWACDPDGLPIWFGDRPCIHYGAWAALRSAPAGPLHPLPEAVDWRLTLRERP